MNLFPEGPALEQVSYGPKATEGTQEYDKILKFITKATKHMKVSPRRVIAHALDSFDEGLILSGNMTLRQARFALGLWYEDGQENNSGVSDD